jgi:hypothetical protein
MSIFSRNKQEISKNSEPKVWNEIKKSFENAELVRYARHSVILMESIGCWECDEGYIIRSRRGGKIWKNIKRLKKQWMKHLK